MYVLTYIDNGKLLNIGEQIEEMQHVRYCVTHMESVPTLLTNCA